MTLSQTEGEYLTLHELIQAARQKLDRNMWEYVVGGTGTETTLARNRQALDRIAFRPRVLRDVSAIDPSHRFFGLRTRLPLLLAPVGGLEQIVPEGSLEAARAASAFGVPFCLSSMTTGGMEAVGRAVSGTKMYQLYVRGDAEWVDRHIRQAREGYCEPLRQALARWRQGTGRHALSGGLQLE
jgi:glycolate oxidase